MTVRKEQRRKTGTAVPCPYGTAGRHHRYIGQKSDGYSGRGSGETWASRAQRCCGRTGGWRGESGGPFAVLRISKPDAYKTARRAV